MARAQFQQATALMQAGKPHDAERACRQALQADPSDVQALRLLGQIIRQTGKAPESVKIFQQMRQWRPNDVQLIGELGASLTAANLHVQALPLLQQAVQTMPSAVQWQVWLGKCYLKLFNTNAAVKILEQAREAAPDDPQVTFHLANALLTAARPAHAEPLIREFLARQPDSIPGLITLSNVLEHENRLDEAVEVLKQILEKDPTFEAALGGLARCLRAEGKYKEALAILEPIVKKTPNADMALAIAPIYLAEKRFEECKLLFETVLRQENIPDPVRSSLTFGLAQSLQGLKDYDGAFRAFKHGNEYYPRNFRREHRLRLYKEIREAFTPELIRNGPRARVDARKCVFILGMPRSGTSLVEQILDAHPRVFGAGELTEIPFTLSELAEKMGGQPPSCFGAITQELLDHGANRYLRYIQNIAPDADFVTDKLPHNFEMIGLINRMLPGAKIIHCKRDPVDNCVSCYFTQLSAWHSYSNDLSNLGWAYGQYVKLMEYWREASDLPILDVQYEDTVADLETQARRILDFVGLEWDDRCLRFYEVERAVTTASVDQVRQPIYKSSVARWKRFGDHVKPLIESLRAAGVEIPEA
ncbi:MAG: sulfotransferase [Phycisphaerales bacterium]|nr:sulfotransferase [Phycisphaerales bacterium]